MARPLRIEYPGAIYHVLSRGDQRDAIVRDDRDRGAVPRSPGADVRTHRVADSRLLSDDESFSLGSGDTAGQLERRNAVALGLLHAAIQSAPPSVRSCLWRTLQGPFGRWPWRGLPAAGMRLRA